jgi:hypothetical protein
MKQILFLALLSTTSVWSQSFILDLKPTFRPIAIGTYRNSSVENNNSIQRFTNITGLGAFGSIKPMADLLKSVEIQVDFIQFKKFKFGVGVGTHTTYLISKISRHADALGVSSNELIYGESITSPENVLGIDFFQPFIILSYAPAIEFKYKPKITHLFSLAMCANFHMNEKPFFEQNIAYDANSPSLPLGSVNPVIFETEIFGTANKFEPLLGIMFRYEMGFKTRKNKNLFNLSLSYHQGTRRVARVSVENLYQNSIALNGFLPSYMKSTSFSRGSGFRIGISKNISIIKPRNHEKM